MSLHFPSFARLSYGVFREIILYDSVYTMDPDEHDEPLLHFHVVSSPIVASHVCRSWRHALLSDSTMWTCLSIPNMKPSGIMELLRRSGSSLLNVFIKLKIDRRLNCNDTSSMLSAVFRELRRFKVLHMQVNPDSFGKTSLKPAVLKRLVRQALSYLQLPAPKLQTLFVWYTDDFDVLDNTFFSKTLFSGIAPNLKHIHHQLSGSLWEIGYPIFHDLSELHLSLLGPVDSDRFLEFLELSPRLNLLRVHITHHHDDAISYVESSSKRRVNLPNLQMLVLEVNHAVEVMNLIFNNVTFPSSIKWQATTQYLEEYEDASPVFQYLPQVPFTSMYVQLTDILAFSFEEKPLSNHTDYFNRHKLGYVYSDFTELMDFWIPLMELIESYDITHLTFEVDPPRYLSPKELFKFEIYPIIIAPLSSNLESLTITYKRKFSYDEDNSSDREDDPSDGEDKSSDGEDKASLSYLTEFMPSLGTSLASENSTDTATADSINPTQDPDLNPVPTDSDSREHPPVNSKSVASTSAAAFPYPRLRELHVELPGVLKEIDAVMLCDCVSMRRREGYPLRIFVRCAGVTESARSILGRDDDICVSVVPFKRVNKV